MSEGATGETPITVSATAEEGDLTQSVETTIAAPSTTETGNAAAESTADSSAVDGHAETENTEGPTVEKVDENPETKSHDVKKSTPVASGVSEYDALVTWVTERLSILGFDPNNSQANQGESKSNTADNSMSSVIVDFITGEGNHICRLMSISSPLMSS